MNIVFDLDGTLIDSKLRLYRLFQHLCPISRLSYEQYWALKREGVSNEAILAERAGFDEAAIAAFAAAWMATIETPEYLALDSNFPGMVEALQRLAAQGKLFVCTDRQQRGPVLSQLEQLRLAPFFADVLVTERRISKKMLIEAKLRDLGADDWFLTDAGPDIETGKSLNLKTCAVLSGFRSRQYLARYEPDRFIDSAVSFDPAG